MLIRRNNMPSRNLLRAICTWKQTGEKTGQVEDLPNGAARFRKMLLTSRGKPDKKISQIYCKLQLKRFK